MQNLSSKVSSIIIILLCLNSVVYLQINSSMNKDSDSNKEFKVVNGIDDFLDIIEDPGDFEILTPMRSVDVPGNYKTQGYFHQYQTVNLDGDGKVWEFQPYEDMKDSGDLCDYEQHRFQSDMPDTMPDYADTWYTMYENSIDIKSAFFTPVFEHETTLDGKIWLAANIRNEWTYNQPQVRYRVRMFLHNETSGINSGTIVSKYFTFAPGENYWYGDMLIGTDIIPFTLSEPVVVPAGFRIKFQFQAQLSRLDGTGHFRVYTNNDGSGATPWVIDDGIYSATYTISGLDDINFGVSFYMYQEKYPEITATGFLNNSYYLIQNRNISINVVDSVNCWYSWDGGAYSPFNDNTWTLSPTSHGWHNLEVKASDEYNNTRTEYYRIGFDGSVQNINLDNPVNGSQISDGSEIQFSAYNISYAMYEWDNNGSIFNLTDSSYSISAPKTSGLHDLTVTSYDEFETVNFFYSFSIDNSSAYVILQNIVNGTKQPASKVIDILITDDSSINVRYKWDSQDDLPWLPFSGNLYRTYLPGLDGDHNLYIYANDTFGHYVEKKFVFTTDNTVLGVELQTMINSSFYYGENEIDLIISGSNNSVYYSWDGGTVTYVDLQGSSSLLLNGSDVLPVTPGVHVLNVTTYDIPETKAVFIFIFTVDRENPVIDSSIYNYDNKRYKDTEHFNFIISDNNATQSELLIRYSINGSIPQNLQLPFIYYLNSLPDGHYLFTLYAYDIANNSAIASFVFIIDTTPPSFDLFDIDGLTQVSDTYYAPRDALVTVDISDDDAYNSTYSWGGLTYSSFIDSFTLSFSDGGSMLYVNASDSLGNHRSYSLYLIIDGTAPIITLLNPVNETSKINGFTEISFSASDSNPDETISLLESYWDIAPLFKTFSLPTVFSLYLIPLDLVYEQNDTVILTITTVDVVGNTKDYVFTFILDKEPPVPTFYIQDPETMEDTPITNFADPENPTYFLGNTSIWYDLSGNDDLGIIKYYFNDEADEVELNISNPYIYLPTTFGAYNLTVTLIDQTEGNSPNSVTYTFYFYVENIIIEVINPTNLFDTTHQLIYDDSFVITLSIYDSLSGLEVPNLHWNKTALDISNNLGLLILNNTLDAKTYQFTVYCTEVGSVSLTFKFYAEGSEKEHGGDVILSIEKKEGTLTILKESTLRVFHESDVEIRLNLKDEYNNNKTIEYISVNGTAINPVDIHNSGLGYSYFYYSTRNLGRGNYSLILRVESENFFGETNTSYFVEIEVLSLPTILQIFASEFNVTYGNNVIISSLLTFLNGTPIEDADIVFYIYIYYKNNTNLVSAFTGYDNFKIDYANTNSTGYATITFQMTDEMAYIGVFAEYSGDQNNFFGSTSFELNQVIRSVKPSGLQPIFLYLIIAAAVILMAIVSFVVYKLTRTQPIDEVIVEITESEIMDKLATINPGVILNIFDQRRGAVPLVSNHDLDSRYSNRFAIGMENFLLKIADQAYSSLGFEEQHDRRRIGSIILPREGMVGFIHGIQLPNADARGGFENLALVVLVNEKDDNALLGNQVYLYDDVDTLTNMLKERRSLEEINEQLLVIRKKAVRIVLAALRLEKGNKRKEK